MFERIRVAADSDPSRVAGAIAGVLRREGHTEVQAIGANAVHRMMKATAIADRYLEDDNLRLMLTPTSIDVRIEGRRRTAMRLFVYAWRPYTNGRNGANGKR